MHNQIPDHIRVWIDRIPIFAAFELDVRAVTASAATLYMPFRPQLTGIFESLHGGLLMTLADTAACVAVLAALSGDDVITTTDMNIRFLGPCLTGATATARVVKAGRTLCPTHVNITDESASLVAIAQVTYMRLPNMPKRKR